MLSQAVPHELISAALFPNLNMGSYGTLYAGKLEVGSWKNWVPLEPSLLFVASDSVVTRSKDEESPGFFGMRTTAKQARERLDTRGIIPVAIGLLQSTNLSATTNKNLFGPVGILFGSAHQIIILNNVPTNFASSTDLRELRTDLIESLIYCK